MMVRDLLLLTPLAVERGRHPNPGVQLAPLPFLLPLALVVLFSRVSVRRSCFVNACICVSRLQSEVKVLRQQLSDSQHLLHSLRLELQVFEKMKTNVHNPHGNDVILFRGALISIPFPLRAVSL